MNDTIETPATAKRKRDSPPGMQLVDLSIRQTVKNAAKVRLNRVRRQEKLNTGVARTTLSDVVRSALVGWDEPEPQPEPPTAKGTAPARVALRFYMPGELYEACKRKIQEGGGSVARVAQDALEHFARTGEY